MEQGLIVRPIGFLRSGKTVKFQASHQPSEDRLERNVLELGANCGYERALQDLAGFSRVWLLWWFHRNTEWRPLVLPPRGPAQRRGLFATRSPHRPNPLGLTAVPLIEVRGRSLILGACDLMDGTPVLDIKPYIAAYDSFPEARAGWWEEVEASLNVPPKYEVRFLPLAETQAEWLGTAWGIDFRPRMIELLSRDPSQHRSRRIRRRGDTRLVIGCGAWRAVFFTEGSDVTIESLEPAYPARFLRDRLQNYVSDRAAQLAYLERWPERAKAAVAPG